MKKIIAAAQSTNRWKLFVGILLLITAIGTIMSIIAHFTFLKDDIETRPRIAIVTPLNSQIGMDFKQGAELSVDTVNFKGGYKGRLVEFFTVDETPEAAEKVLADKRVIGVVGYFNPELLKQVAPIYEQKHVPVVTPLFLPEPIAGVTALDIDPKDQARFVANYARNIQQQRLMYVIREEGAEFDSFVEPFIEVYKRFDIPVRQVWTISKNADKEAQIKKMLGEIQNIDIGGIYFATSTELATRLVKEIRLSNNSLEIYGTAQLASNAFAIPFVKEARKDVAALTHGIIASTPALFDTANEKAQNFQRYYQEKFGLSPDWIATYAYDAVKIALSEKPGEMEVQGILGSLNFANHQAQIPIQMGIYSDELLISAPVQLQPIAKGSNFNYIEALKQGRVLYVNDRFMFKTNVVYAGIKVNELSDLDLQKETATIDMTIWFRYRGDFLPQDVHIFNSLDPIKLGTPEESKEGEEIQYRRYRIKEKFKLNFTQAKRAYGQHVAGISFRHRQLNYNNVMYVVDVLGMPTAHALIEDLHKRHVLKSNTGWEIENAWESQDVVSENGDGAPQYVGMTGEKPLFSKITLGMLIKPTASARDIIPSDYFIYIAIFGVLGAIFALMMDHRQWGRFWAMQSWLLRLIFWPLVLLSLGNLILDFAFASFSPVVTVKFVVIYESLWWVLGAILFDIGVRRFIWDPLALYGNSKVPNVIKLFVTILIFAFAFSGILVFVFNQSPTSLLATSGVLAMVIGMAVKDIIANVFSGIILNFERPFKVGDKIKINSVTGVVKDITWRTTRLESTEGHMVSLANGKVTEAFMENYSQTPNGVREEVNFYTKPDVDPAFVLTTISDGLNTFCREVPSEEPQVRYKGVVNINGDWVANYVATYRLLSSGRKAVVKENLCMYVQEKLGQNPATSSTSVKRVNLAK